MALTTMTTTSRPTHPVELLACAIATQEGWFVENSAPQVLCNPGDLKAAGQKGVIGSTQSGLAHFVDDTLGITALFRQLWLQVAEGQTVRQIIAQWAPPNENNTSVYLENVLQWTGLPADVPVLELLPGLVALNV